MKDAPEVRDLVTIAKKDALSFFTQPDAIAPVLDRIRQEIDTFEPDVRTAAGRKAIASIAYRVAQSKTYLDGVGKDLVAEYKEIPKKIDATRKRLRDTLDEWRDEVRRPLTEWEDAEQARVDAINASLAEFQAVIDDQTDRPADVLRERLAEIKGEAISQQFYGEYTGKAAELKDRATRALDAQLALAEKREAEAAAAAKLQAEADEKARQEREEQIAREVVERQTADLRRAVEEAEQRAVEAARKARREMEENAERERAEQAKRAANKEHLATVNRAALAALVENGIPEDIAKQVVKLIALKAIPAVSISY